MSEPEMKPEADVAADDSAKKMREALEDLRECTAHMKREDGKCSQLCKRCIIDEALT